MGGGFYSTTARVARAHSVGYDTKSVQEIFTQKTINSSMNPHGIVVRESRNSVEHPNSLAILLALDVTGSMGSVPHHLVKEGLPNIMQSILDSGIQDPQVLFVGIGDHECDSFPLQVGQFESSDALLDKWLTDLYLEGGGGGNEGESYLLAWYFAAKHTEIDCIKRGQKGFLFTIGDEPVLKSIPSSRLKDIMGDGQYSQMTSDKLLEEARKKYHVFHIHIRETAAGARNATVNGWKQLIGEGLLIAESHRDVPRIISEAIKNNLNKNNAQDIYQPPKEMIL